MSDITLYFAPASRAFTARWLLEELGLPYRVKTVSLRKGAQKSPSYLQINSMGKVPALTDGPVTVSENPAICIYLADRYSLGNLAPRLDAAERGSYLRWMIFSTAVFEPAIYLEDDGDELAASGRGWGSRSSVLEVLDDALCVGPWLLGEQFSAADVMLGSLLSIALFNQRIAQPAESLVRYAERLSRRPAYERAAKATWP
ncbi:glutathione S-transferase family protein [Paraburkholderia sp. ZP32-5]|uniref:glutathione S-transferase family protein n=1 Tax=Paraburkholderia sp. ZP32-5 TaxID=2883245 RepID=UPI001F35175E|nr:glutathione S-transferase family protein [Paraburkholderia sp. ZP32-5]